jgi:hypothetical protein
VTKWYDERDFDKAVTDVHDDSEPATIMRVHIPDRYVVIRGVSGGLAYQGTLEQIKKVYPDAQITPVDEEETNSQIVVAQVNYLVKHFGAARVLQTVQKLASPAGECKQ